MEIVVPKFVTYLLAWFGTIGGIWALFDRAETVLSREVKLKITHWLRKKSTFTFTEWPIIFNLLFDQVYGEKHLSWKCFYRSMITSISSIVILILLVEGFTNYKVLNETEGFNQTLYYFTILFWFTFLYNVITDYISLILTRITLKRIIGKSIIVRLLFLLINIALSMVVIIVMYSIADHIYMAWHGIDDSVKHLKPSFSKSLQTKLEMILHYASFSPIDNEYIAGMAPWVYSTFVPSFWIWLFLIGGFVIKVLNKLSIGLNKLKLIFNLEEKPLRSIGFICMVLVTIAFIVLPFT